MVVLSLSVWSCILCSYDVLCLLESASLVPVYTRFAWRSTSSHYSNCIRWCFQASAFPYVFMYFWKHINPSHINWSLQRLASWQIARCKSRWRIKASKLEYGEEDHSRFCNFIQQGDLELYHISFENFTEPVFSPIKHWSDNLILLGLRSYRSTLFIWLWIRWHWDCDSPTVYHTLYGWNPGLVCPSSAGMARYENTNLVHLILAR